MPETADVHPRIAYFYCAYKNAKTHDSLLILGALARQLAVQNPRCLSTMEQFCAIDYSAEGSATTGLLITLEDLHDLIQSLSAFFDEVMIIIDALDECGNDRSKVVELLSGLNVHGFNVKILFTSRLETDIEVHLESYRKISIAMSEG